MNDEAGDSGGEESTPGQPQGMERRMAHRLLVRWRAAQEDDGIPSLDALFHMDLKEMLPNIYVLKTPAPGEDPEFVQVGGAFNEEGGDGLIGATAAAVDDATLLGKAMRYYKKILSKKVPITLGGEFVKADGTKILYRSIIVPLSDDGNSVNLLLGAANCKVKKE